MAVLLFPGQGSQAVGMGKDLHDAHPEVRALYDEAVEILGFDLRKISFEGPEEELRKTQYTQPALFVHSLAVDLLMKQHGDTPDATAGHSLGEFSAVVSAGALEFADALKVVKVRGEEMGQAGEKAPGTMAAVIGATDEQIADICEEASKTGVVVPANLNSPGQVVLSGTVEGIDKAVEVAKAMGIRRAMKLNVSGAFHSPLMTPARVALESALNGANFVAPKIPIYQNVTATAVTDPTILRNNLVKQLENPVRWAAIIEQMWNDGHKEYIEVGSGKVLQGLSRRITPEALTFGLSSATDIASRYV